MARRELGRGSGSSLVSGLGSEGSGIGDQEYMEGGKRKAGAVILPIEGSDVGTVKRSTTENRDSVCGGGVFVVSAGAAS